MSEWCYNLITRGIFKQKRGKNDGYFVKNINIAGMAQTAICDT